MKKHGFGTLGKDLTLDMGTETTRIATRGQKALLLQPTLVASESQTGTLRAVGLAAQALQQQTPGGIIATRPIRQSAISDYSMTQKLLQDLLQQAAHSRLTKPNLLFCVPSGITQVQARAFADVAIAAGGKRVRLMEAPLAAAIGLGLDIHSPKGALLVDIGAGTTKISLLSLSAIALSRMIPIAGEQFDEAIVKYIRHSQGLLIGGKTAQTVKHTIGCVTLPKQEAYLHIKGRCLSTGLPRALNLSSTEMLSACGPIAQSIVDAIAEVLERTPPALYEDIQETGLYLFGGGSLLTGFSSLLTARLDLPVISAENPQQVIIDGALHVLSNPDLLHNLLSPAEQG